MSEEMTIQCLAHGINCLHCGIACRKELSSTLRLLAEERDRFGKIETEMKQELSAPHFRSCTCLLYAEKIKKLEAEVEEQCRLNGMGASREAKLMATIERQAWNLGGCLTYAEGVGVNESHSKEWATPALEAVQRMAKENAGLKAANEKLVIESAKDLNTVADGTQVYKAECARLFDVLAKAREALSLSEGLPELNMMNYSADEVSNLNYAVISVCLNHRNALAEIDCVMGKE